MFVRDVMLCPIAVVPSDISLRETAQRMKDAGQPLVVVADGSGIHGFVTERELVFGAQAQAQDHTSEGVGFFASDRFIFTRESETVADLAQRMLREHARRAIVVDREGDPVGVVSAWELARRFRRQARRDAIIVEAQEEFLRSDDFWSNGTLN